MKPAMALLAVAMLQAERPLPSVRDGVLFGGVGMGPFAAVTDPAVAARWKAVEERAKRMQSKLRPGSGRGGEWRMVMAKRKAYESLLFAVGTPVSLHADSDVRIQEEAVAFVEGLRPCYEWEGFSDCPQKEAEFAEYWLKWNATGAFRDFLPVFASHRWICAAEGLEYEKKPNEAAEARNKARALLEKGKSVEDPLMRHVAAELRREPRCHTPR